MLRRKEDPAESRLDPPEDQPEDTSRLLGVVRAYGACVAALAIWIPLSVRSIHSLLDADGNDFTILHAAARRLLDGAPVYDGAYMYPPTLALLLVPFALLPMVPAGIIWMATKIALFHFAAATFIPKSSSSLRLRRNLILLSPLLVFRFVESDLVNGNTNIALLAGIALALRKIESGRANWAGAVLALVSAVKLAPTYLLLALGVARFRRVAATGLVLVPALLALSAVVSPDGWEGTRSGFLGTSESVFTPEEVDAESRQGGYLPGQSLRPIVHRLMRPIDATAHDRRHVPIHLVELSPTTAEWIYRGIALGLALFGLFACRGQSARWSIAWALVVMLLVSPYSRKAHFVLLLPAVVMILEAAIASAGARRAGFIATLGVAWALGQLTMRGLWGKDAAALLVGYGVVGAAALALLPALWHLRGHRERGVQRDED